jgi:hypothetical protein
MTSPESGGRLRRILLAARSPASAAPGSGGFIGAGSGSAAGGESRAPLLAADELESIVARWKDVQADFVDDPRRAVQDADDLVADLMKRIAETLASEKQRLESRWASGEQVSTEDLRQGLRGYRSFFERLLTA